MAAFTPCPARDDNVSMDLRLLRTIYLQALERCRPSRLMSGRDVPRAASVVILGKAAEELARGVEKADRWFIAAPEGYARREAFPEEAQLFLGSHPGMTGDSFVAGAALRDFVKSCIEPILFLISGGSSSCVEWPLEPWFSQSDLIRVNNELIKVGWDIEKINTVRKHLSAIKGGRLGEAAPQGSRVLILSDVVSGRPDLVGSGPTFGDRSTNADAASLLEALGMTDVAKRLGDAPETPKTTRVDSHTLADNRSLVRAAAEEVQQLGYGSRVVSREIDGDVQTEARNLFQIASALSPGTVVVAGGEPTVRVSGSGRGGRCCELAVRFAWLARQNRVRDVLGLFASSDGRDGNSGVAGAMISLQEGAGAALSEAEIIAALELSDSFSLIERVGEPIIIPTTGNNLRDLFLLART